MQLVLALIFLGIIGYDAWTFYSLYSASTETGWHRWLDAAQKSATILWSKFVRVIAAVTGLLVSAADYFNEPTISAAIQKYMTPQAWAALTVVIMIVTIWARQRKSSSDPVS